MAVLGCASQYDVMVVSKGGIPLGSLEPATVAWGRVLDDTSEATVVVNVNPQCASILSKIHVWHYEIQLFRDSVYVWSGPIVQITGTRTTVTIVARDLFALLNERVIHNPICFATECSASEGTGAPADLTDIGIAIIKDALVVDGHGYSIVSEPTGIFGQRLYQPGENALTCLQEALKLGLDATMLGPQFVLGAANGAKPFGRTATLTCDDFLGDISFEEDGLSLATRAITLGTGYVGIAKSPGSDLNGVDPYYGLIEYVSVSRPELTTQALADSAAAALITSRWPAPTSLIMPAGSQLNVNAPVSIPELVPGVISTILADCLIRSVQADMVLVKLDVTWDVTGEKVAVTYASLGSQNDGTNA